MSLMKWIRILFSSFLLIGLALTGSFAVAADDEETLTDKAGSQLIESMPDFFQDVIEMKKMSEPEKVNYILTKSAERIQEKLVDKVKADMEKALMEYAKASFLAKANKEAINAAYLPGAVINWVDLDNKVKSKVDTQMNGIAVALKAVKIGWGTIDAFSTGGMIAGFESLGKGVSEALVEAYVPGWGIIKISAQLIQILGRVVLDYATNTALEGMQNDWYGMKSNPQGLAQWLIDKTPADIKKDVETNWNDGMGYGRLWEGQGTDKGDEVMQDRIISTLITLRGEVLAKKREEEQKQSVRVKEAMEQAKNAETKIKEVARKTQEDAKGPLDKIREFRLKVTGIAKAVAEKRIADAEKAFEDEVKRGTGAIPYQPISRSTVVSALDTALSEIQDSGQGGYEQAAYNAAIENYKEKRKSILEAGAKAVADGVAVAYGTIDRNDKNYLPQILAAQNQADACGQKYGRDKCLDAWKAVENLNKARSNANRLYYQTVYGALGNQFNADVAIMVAEENVIRAKAQERFIKRYQELHLGVQDLQKRLQEAGVRYNTDKAALVLEIGNLHHNYIWRAPEEVYKQNPPYTTAGETITMPGDVTGQLEGFKKLKKELTEDGETAMGLHVKEKAIFQTYRLEVESIARKFKEIAPTKLYNEEIPFHQGPWVPGKILSVKQFTTDQFSIRPGMQEGTAAYYGVTVFPGYDISIPSMGELSFEDYEKKINLSPTEFLAKKLRQLDARISFLEGIVDADQMLLTLMKLFDRVMVPILAESIKRDMAQEKAYLSETFYTESQFMHVEVTPGLKYLKDLKAAWQVNEIFIRKMERLRNAAKKQVQYSYPYQDRYYPVVEKLILTPEKIKLAEEEYAKSQKKTSDRLSAVDTYLAEWKNKLVALEKRTRSLAYLTEDVQELLGFVNNQVDVLRLWNWAPHKDVTDRIQNATEFQKELQVKLKQSEEATKIAEEALRRHSQESQQQSEAEQKKKKEEEARRASTAVQNMADIKAFYDQFKSAYEGRNDALLMSFISGEWQAGDGSTLSALQTNLRRSFRMFDEIKYNIQNLVVTLAGAGRYNVSYDVTITSKIYKRNLKHEEKSTINEEVTISGSGKVKISKTLGGQFWYTQ